MFLFKEDQKFCLARSVEGRNFLIHACEGRLREVESCAPHWKDCKKSGKKVSTGIAFNRDGARYIYKDPESGTKNLTRTVHSLLEISTAPSLVDVAAKNIPVKTSLAFYDCI